MKKSIAVILLFSLLSPYCFSREAQLAESQFADIYSLIDQLIDNQKQQSELITKLQTASESDRIAIEQTLERLRKSEEETKRQIALSRNLGALIQDQAIYSKSLEKKLKFWRITTGILAALFAGFGIAVIASK